MFWALGSKVKYNRNTLYMYWEIDNMKKRTTLVKCKKCEGKYEFDEICKCDNCGGCCICVHQSDGFPDEEDSGIDEWELFKTPK